jgi:hypothetical protein
LFAQDQEPTTNVTSKEEMTLVFTKMEKAIKNIKSAKFRLVKKERWNKKYSQIDESIKQNVKPLKIHIKVAKGPIKGTEILYNTGQNEGKAYVKVSPFTPTVNLNPLGVIINEKQRHTLFELGFAYSGKKIYETYQKFKEKPSEYAIYGGIVKWENCDAYKFTLDNKEYKIKDYVVLDGEDIIKIADKLQLDEYTILELNPTIKNYTDVKVGQSILIPSTFAKTVVVYIDAKNFLPIYQKIIDSKGLVSEYEYHELIINPIISDEEFTKAYKGYSF